MKKMINFFLKIEPLLLEKLKPNEKIKFAEDDKSVTQDIKIAAEKLNSFF